MSEETKTQIVLDEKRRLPDIYKSFLEYEKESETGKLIVEWNAISLIAATVQRRIWLRIANFEPHYANFMIIVVGKPATRKSTSMRTVTRILRDLDVTIAPAVNSLPFLIQCMEKSKKDFVGIDGSVYTHCSLSAFADELSTFLSSGDADTFLKMLCDWEGCPPVFDKGTKFSGCDGIVNMFFNFLANTTPVLLPRILPPEHIGSGFSSRVIYVFSEESGVSPLPRFQVSEEGKKLYEDLLHDLSFISQFSGGCTMSEECKNAYVTWYVDMRRNVPDCPFDPTHFNYYWSRRQVHLARLMMIFAISDASANFSHGALVIDERHFDKALGLLLRTELQMPRVFSAYGAYDKASIVGSVLSTIRSKNALKKKLTEADLYNMFSSDFGPTEFNLMIDNLVKMKVITNNALFGLRCS